MEVEGSDAAAALASPGPPAAPPGTQALIAGAGSEYVRRVLCVSEPGEAIENVQRRGALRDPACEPLVGLLDHMGQSRAEVRAGVNNQQGRLIGRRRRQWTATDLCLTHAQVYHEMMTSALELVKKRVDAMSTPALLRLLDVRRSSCCRCCLSLLSSHPARRTVCVPVHRRGGAATHTPGSAQPAEHGSDHVPEAGTPACPSSLSRRAPELTELHSQLAADMDLFRLLPRAVQRQVWEMDGLLFRRHASLSLEMYGDEVATVMRELDMVRFAARSVMPAAPLTSAACAGPAFSTAAWPNSACCSWQRRPRQAAARAAQEGHPQCQRKHPAPGEDGATTCGRPWQNTADAVSCRQVDSSKKLYASLISLCRWYFAKESMLAACSLRSQLQLAFSESKLFAGGGAPLDMAAADRCFELTRELDACLKVLALAPLLAVQQPA